jgi:hypothetical protein
VATAPIDRLPAAQRALGLRVMACQNARPMTSSTAAGRRLAFALTLAGATLLAACGAPDATPRPAATDSPVAAQSPEPEPTRSPSATDASDDETVAVLEQIEEDVTDLRGLPPPDIPPVEIIGRADLADELDAIFESEYPEEEREEDNIALRALGLLTADEDYAELQREMLGAQVLGFYSPLEKRMVVVTDAGLDAQARLTYAHEYTHALQDAAFDAAALQEQTREEDDASMALLSLEEGDANLTMLAWAVNGGLEFEELVELGEDVTVPETPGIPDWMLELLLFPYIDGQTFVASLAGPADSPQSALLDPDFTQVDAAFGDPPESTEQVIHLDKWESREAPVELEAAELAESLTAAVGGEWADITPTTMGEALTRITLVHYGVPDGDARDAAAGWGGDELAVASGPQGAFALAWRLAWDSSADAREFADAYASILGELPFEAELVETGDDELLVLHASSADVLAAARAALAP